MRLNHTYSSIQEWTTGEQGTSSSAYFPACKLDAGMRSETDFLALKSLGNSVGIIDRTYMYEYSVVCMYYVCTYSASSQTQLLACADYACPLHIQLFSYLTSATSHESRCMGLPRVSKKSTPRTRGIVAHSLFIFLDHHNIS